MRAFIIFFLFDLSFRSLYTLSLSKAIPDTRWFRQNVQNSHQSSSAPVSILLLAYRGALHPTGFARTPWLHWPRSLPVKPSCVIVIRVGPWRRLVIGLGEIVNVAQTSSGRIAINARLAIMDSHGVEVKTEWLFSFFLLFWERFFRTFIYLLQVYVDFKTWSWEL